MKRLSPEQQDAVRALEVNGIIRPDAVVDAARNPASVLNSLFEWRDDEAAEKYRLLQARSVIRLVPMTVHRGPRVLATPRYVSLGRRAPEPGYVEILRLKTETQQRDLAIAEINRALGVLERARRTLAVFGLDPGAEAAISATSVWLEQCRLVSLPMPPTPVEIVPQTGMDLTFDDPAQDDQADDTAWDDDTPPSALFPLAAD